MVIAAQNVVDLFPAETRITVLGIAFTLVMGLLLILLPRRYALAPVIMLACYMTMGQVIVIFGLHFTMIRVLILLGWARLFIRREVRALKLNSIDKVLICWTISSVVMNTLLWRTSDAFVNRLGLAYNAIGMYFLFRFLVVDLDDIRRIFKMTAVFIVPVAAAMLVEKLTGRNMFAILGGVSEITQVREGVLRCQGPFGHPILAGTFGATLLPFFVALWWQRSRNRLLAATAIIASTIIVIAAGSSGPVMTYVASLAALAMWFLRKHMRTVRWGLLLTVIGLHLVMKAPVWFLIARIHIFTASTGYHRALLIDRAIANFGDWWLVGTKSIAPWSDTLANPGTPTGDVTNFYILQGVNGGVLTLVLFVTIIAYCFRWIGRAIATFRDEPLSIRRSIWVLGAALFSHIVTFLSVSYYDQNYVNWYLLLAMISAATDVALTSRRPVYAATSMPRDDAHIQAAAH